MSLLRSPHTSPNTGVVLHGQVDGPRGQLEPVRWSHQCRWHKGVDTGTSRGVANWNPDIGDTVDPCDPGTDPRTGKGTVPRAAFLSGIPVGYFLTWQASSSTPHWCPSRCRRTWHIVWWSTQGRRMRAAMACSVLLSFFVLRTFYVYLLPQGVVCLYAGVVVALWLLGNLVLAGCSDAYKPRASSAVCAEPYW